MLSSSTERLPALTPREIALGEPIGAIVPARPEAIPPDPVHALRESLRSALARTPCVVAFSGGRDSALLLAVAADLAGREGFDRPVALTLRYPGDPAADETRWQDMVVGHLGERVEWVRRDVTGELDILGPEALPVLRAHGRPTYPATLGNTVLLSRHARGGSLVTGNGGDEVLGGHRSAILRAVARKRGRGLTAADWRLTALCAAPTPVRGLLAAQRRPWLRPAMRRTALAESVRRERLRALRWDRGVWAALAPRAVEVGRRTREAVARDHDCVLVEPLAEPGFVAAFAHAGARTRAAATRLLAGGLLPEAVVARRDKAHVAASRFGAASREFARAWDGRGVDETLVDPVALRAAWLSAGPPPSTAMLLQQAWLARTGATCG